MTLPGPVAAPAFGVIEIDVANACRQLGLKMQPSPVGEAGDLEGAFARLPQSRETALLGLC
jgi:hypothetical protein